ncbi:MAG: DUF4012 domain-containing protein [Candidatus Moranbacteria bacterium]|jgi:hypothetical protein|nr:DUF4012 domain-containing protein [Candidatus Moranbacteria bacterium]
MGEHRKKIVTIIIITLLLAGGGVFLISWDSKKFNKQTLLMESLSAFEKVANLLPIKEDSKKEIEAINQVVQFVTRVDDIERRYLLLLQNNMELRPGGGFLGQYAIIKVKNGKITSQFFEDANILDQRITAKVNPPYPFERMMSLKKWKFRDSNFSPDFPTNVEKAKYFYRLSGGNSDFDGVIAVNATVLNKILEITGPIVIGGVQYTSQDAFLKLEEQVEKAYLFNEDLDTQNRKWVMKKMAEIIIDRLVSLNNIPRISSFVLEELRNKDIQLNFQDSETQKAIENVHWDGRVSTDWEGDYLMIVDANMGALKSDYYIDREVFYEVDLTGEKPTAYLKINYTHKATYGDWRTSDYHSYLRIYVPQGSNLIERKMVSYPNIQEEFNKTYFGFILHVLINRNTLVETRYELPESVRENYRLLIQKQSGVGDVPVHIKVKTADGDFTQDEILKKDLRFEFKK